MERDLTEVTDIWDVVEPYLAAERLELDDLELTGHGRGRVLRITVDGNALDVDRLADVSRGLSRLLDTQTDLEGSYQLEVSSPGLERKLRRPRHFAKALGREVVVKYGTPEGAVSRTGALTAVDDHGFTLDDDLGQVVVPYDSVVSARTIFRLEKTPKPGH